MYTNQIGSVGRMTLLCVAVDTNQIGSVGRMTLLCVAVDTNQIGSRQCRKDDVTLCSCVH